MVFPQIPLPTLCVCNHLFIGKNLFGLKAKQINTNHWILKINPYHTFDNLEAKQIKMDPWIKKNNCRPSD